MSDASPTKPRDVLVATHGHCFDGMASAALFTRLRREIEPRGALSLRYKSCGYGPGMQMIPEAWLDGDENAILDFRFTPSARVRWYFDHHVTGFGSRDEEARAFERRSSKEAPLDIFYEPTYGSCTKLIADRAKDHYAVELAGVEELVRWADIIDAARFSSAEAATNRDEPVLQLAAVVEHHGDGPFLNDIVPKLLERALAEVATAESIRSAYAPIAQANLAFAERVRAAGREMGPVVLVDLGDVATNVGAKFVTYALFPRCTYSVTLLKHRQHIKISVGYNPWSGVPRTHDIASICRAYDGGGHPAVGACSFPLGAIERAREAAANIVKQLGG
ncbi:MAG TPA: hypothetical protein VGM56_02315 [Byssovorax sp.]|jgi:hypothetical protein